MPELIPVLVTLEVTKLERRLIAVDLDDYEHDMGDRQVTEEGLERLIQLTPDWEKRFGSDDADCLEIGLVRAEAHPVQEGEPPR